jgi:hypothetical protein
MAAGIAAAADSAYRVLVTTDLGGDPDDIQSLYRLVHYSDVLRVEGIVSSVGPGARHSADKIVHWLQRIDVNHLRRRGHPELMEEATLIARVRRGAGSSGGPSPDRATEGSRFLVERARAADPEGQGRVLWVQAWGALTDVAQALHDAPDIAGKIRLYSIGFANTRSDPAAREYVYEGMRNGRWPKLWWIENGTLPLRKYDTFKGVHQGGDQSGEWNNVEFVNRNIRGKGSTHNGDFAEKAGDVFPLANFFEQKGILKEGDSPAMLYLLSPVIGAVGSVDDPTGESWGGQFRRPHAGENPNYFVDLDLTPEECWRTINKWRVQYLSDWKKRWNWY